LTGHIDLNDTDIPETIVKAYIPGFTVLDNVYLKNGEWVIVGADELPTSHTIKMMDSKVKRVSKQEATSVLGTGFAARVPGTAYLFSETRPMPMHAHYFHFVEYLIGLISILSSANLPATPSLILFPQQDDTTEKKIGWRDEPGLNGHIITSMFPNAVYITHDHWVKQFANSPITRVFNRIAIADRDSAHHDPLNQQWNKMLARIVEIMAGKKNEWFQIRETALRSMDIRESVPSQKMIVTYMTRATDGHRKLTDEQEEAFKKALNGLGHPYEIHVENMGRLSPKEQIALIRKTDILVSIHGNGLTHAIWMRPGTTLIELFPDGSFTRDYDIFCEMVGVFYKAVWMDRAFKAQEIRQLGYQAANLNPKITEINIDLVVRVIKDVATEE
jgi:hypothetical protein